MKTYLIIVNYNDYESTCSLVENIKEDKDVDKIIIVDNASSNCSLEKLKELESRKVIVLSAKENKGYGAGINIGIKYIEPHEKDCNIIVSNPDIIIEKDVIKRLVSHLKDNKIGLVGPTILEQNKKNRGWKIPSPTDDILFNIAYFHRFFQKRRMYYQESHYQTPTSLVETISFCFFLTTLKTMQEIGYFDESVFLYYEENIIGTKLQEKKKKVLIDNEVSVIHNHSVTIDKSLKKIQKYKALKQSQAYFQKEYHHANKIERFLLWLTNKSSLIILYLIYWVQDRFH